MARAGRPTTISRSPGPSPPPTRRSPPSITESETRMGCPVGPGATRVAGRACAASECTARAPTRSRSGSRTRPAPRDRRPTSSCASTRGDPGASCRSRRPAGSAAPSFPYPIRISHPAGPPPLSGIRGYAVSIDRAAAASPCARRIRLHRRRDRPARRYRWRHAPRRGTPRGDVPRARAGGQRLAGPLARPGPRAAPRRQHRPRDQPLGASRRAGRTARSSSRQPPPTPCPEWRRAAAYPPSRRSGSTTRRRSSRPATRWRRPSSRRASTRSPTTRATRRAT